MSRGFDRFDRGPPRPRAAQYVQDDCPTTAAEMQQVLAALGMAQALFDAGTWDEPPHESWDYVPAAADSAVEAAEAASGFDILTDLT